MTANSIPESARLTRVTLAARLRGWAVVAVWAGCLLLLGPVALTLFFFIRNPNVIYRPARFGCWLGFKVAGIDVTVHGLERLDPGRAYIFVANHQSWLDAAALFLYLRPTPAFLVKKELFRLPIFNPGLYWIDCVPVDRRDREKAIESTRRAAERVRRGRSFIVFPEGTRTPDGRLHGFKKGAFHMAVEAGAPVVPISVKGTFELMPKGPVQATPGAVIVTVHEPIEVSGYSRESVDALAETARRVIQSALSQPWGNGAPSMVED